MLNDKEKGGLGVGSISAFNKSLLYKWKWRVLTADSDVIWLKVLKACHGNNVGLSSTNGITGGGVWKTIVAILFIGLSLDGFIQDNTLNKVVRNGISTRFWKDVWCGEASLQVRFPRLFLLSTNANGMVRDFWLNGRWNFQWHLPIRGGAQQCMLHEMMEVLADCRCSDEPDVWRWNLDPAGTFTVRSLRSHIDSLQLPEVDIVTRWIRLVPIKVNILVWRLGLNRLPTLDNLDRK